VSRDPFTAGELVTRIALGKTSAERVTADYLRRIDAMDPKIHSFITVDPELAHRQARAVDQRIAAGESPGRLAGLPVALKDNLVTTDLPTTCGSRILARWRPPYDSTVAARLREAGAVVVGKLNMDEFSMGSSTETSAHGPCRNPWALDRVPGGSSGGAAAAVAARLCAAAVGTDTGGSVRQPAALCGVVGLRPTYGRVSRYGLVAFASSLDQAGPLGRCVEDCALLLEVLGGADAHDATSLAATPGSCVSACRRGARGLRVGVPAECFGDAIAAEVAAAVRSAVDVLRELGAEPLEVSLPHLEHALSAYYVIANAEASANLARYDGVRYGARATDAPDLDRTVALTRGRGFGAEVKRRIMLGTFALSAGYREAYYDRAQRVRALVSQQLADALRRCDLLAMPTSPTTAFRLGERVDAPLAMAAADLLTVPASLAGLPALSLPCGLDASGLPIGLQLVGPRLGEPALFAAAGAYEAATPWRALQPPPVLMSARAVDTPEDAS
jgi:aspartyl-tRNA(Asn)/glutamyl-tRNA(Gln) amidotransferase subunit A